MDVPLRCPDCQGVLTPQRVCTVCGTEWLTPSDAARDLGVHRSRVQYLLDTDQLPGIPVPAVRWLRRRDVRTYRDQHPRRKLPSNAPASERLAC